MVVVQNSDISIFCAGLLIHCNTRVFYVVLLSIIHDMHMEMEVKNTSGILGGGGEGFLKSLILMTKKERRW
jgi:hypothetical protein